MMMMMIKMMMIKMMMIKMIMKVKKVGTLNNDRARYPNGFWKRNTNEGKGCCIKSTE